MVTVPLGSLMAMPYMNADDKKNGTEELWSDSGSSNSELDPHNCHRFRAAAIPPSLR